MARTEDHKPFSSPPLFLSIYLSPLHFPTRLSLLSHTHMDRSPPRRSLKDKALIDNGDLEAEEEAEEVIQPPLIQIPMMRGRGSGSGSVGGAANPICQAEKCMADLTEAKRYHRRHKVCEAHAKAATVIVAGLRQRFCQQCSSATDHPNAIVAF